MTATNQGVAMLAHASSETHKTSHHIFLNWEQLNTLIGKLCVPSSAYTSSQMPIIGYGIQGERNGIPSIQRAFSVLLIWNFWTCKPWYLWDSNLQSTNVWGWGGEGIYCCANHTYIHNLVGIKQLSIVWWYCTDLCTLFDAVAQKGKIFVK